MGVLEGKYNEKCDCWSSGVIMYMLITGVAPFPGINEEQIFESISKKEVEFPDKFFNKFSKETVDLLSNLLNKDVEKRITAQEALEHKWFDITSDEKNFDNIDKSKLEKIAENLKKYNNDKYHNMKFQQACISFIVHNMVKKEDVKEYKKIFNQFDTNSDGRLTREELIKGFSHVMGEEDARDNVNRLIEHIDKDKNDFIEFEEFLSAFMDKKLLLKEDNLMEAYMHFDKDGSGKITLNELKVIMTGNCDVEENVWEEMVLSIDQNSDGEISYGEFKKMMRLMLKD